jgi:hypothetical protein
MRRSHFPRQALGSLLVLLVITYVAVGLAAAEQIGTPEVQVSFDGSISPRVLPRHDPAPVFLHLRGSVRSNDGSPPPRLGSIELAFGARGGLDTAGLPVCPRTRLRNATQRQALERCRGALVGRGQISAEVPLNPADPIPARAGILAFNGRTSCASSGNSSATRLNEPPHARTRLRGGASKLSQSDSSAPRAKLKHLLRAFASGSGGHAALIQNPRSAGRDRRESPRSKHRNLTPLRVERGRSLMHLVPLARIRVAARRGFDPAERPADYAQGSRRRDAPCHRRPTVWVHAYSAYPPVSFVLPFYLRRQPTGAYGVLMRSPVRRALGRWPRLRSFDITLGRRYRVDGDLRSYLNARCPLPPRFDVLTVPVARATYYFAPRPTLIQPILRRCRVRQ